MSTDNKPLQHLDFARLTGGACERGESPRPFIEEGPFSTWLLSRSDSMLRSMRDAYDTAHRLAAVLQRCVYVYRNRHTGMYLASELGQNPQRWRVFDRVDSYVDSQMGVDAIVPGGDCLTGDSHDRIVT